MNQVRYWRAVSHELKASRINEPVTAAGGGGRAHQSAHRFASLDRRISVLTQEMNKKTEEHSTAVLRQLYAQEQQRNEWQSNIETKIEKLTDLIMLQQGSK